MGRWRAPENGEQRTENGTPLRGDGWGVEKMDKPPNLDRLNVARLSQRPRRTTKIHKARRSLDHRGSQRNPQRFTEKVCRVLSQRTRRTTVQARSDKPSTAKGHKGDSTTLGRAVRARKAHVRPGGLRGHGGLRTPCLGGRGAGAPRGAFKEMQEIQEIQERAASARWAKALCVSGVSPSYRA